MIVDEEDPCVVLLVHRQKIGVLGDDDVVVLAGVRSDIVVVRDASVEGVDDVFALVTLPSARRYASTPSTFSSRRTEIEFPPSVTRRPPG